MDRVVPPEVVEFLAPFADQVTEIVLALRSRVLRRFPLAHETVWDATNAVSLVYSPTARWQDGVVHLAAYSRHANLGFHRGAALEDPWSVLAGTGRLIRHVSMYSVADTTAAWIDGYIVAALVEAGYDASTGDGGTTIRASRGPKRRPGPAAKPRRPSGAGPDG